MGHLTYNENSFALPSDRGTLQLSGALEMSCANLMYEGARVKSWMLGRDVNPAGRGDGAYYAQGAFSIGSVRPSPTTTPVGGWGNSVNNWHFGWYDDPCWKWHLFPVVNDPCGQSRIAEVNFPDVPRFSVVPNDLDTPCLGTFIPYELEWHQNDHCLTGLAIYGRCPSQIGLKEVCKEDFCFVDEINWKFGLNECLAFDFGGTAEIVQFNATCNGPNAPSESEKRAIVGQFYNMCAKIGLLSTLGSPPFKIPPLGKNYMFGHLARLCAGEGIIDVGCKCYESQGALQRYCGYTIHAENEISGIYRTQLCYAFVDSQGVEVPGGMRTESKCETAGSSMFVHEFAHACLWHDAWRFDWTGETPCQREFQAEGCRKFFTGTLAGGTVSLYACKAPRPGGGMYTFGVGSETEDVARVNPSWCANWKLPIL